MWRVACFVCLVCFFVVVWCVLFVLASRRSQSGFDEREHVFGSWLSVFLNYDMVWVERGGDVDWDGDGWGCHCFGKARWSSGRIKQSVVTSLVKVTM